MSEEKCCCNCLHCARWSTSKGIECHCDLTDRYLGYLEVMDTDNNCCRWEKETKWDLEKEHDAKVRADAIDEFVKELEFRFFDDGLWEAVTKEDVLEIQEQLKEKNKT